MKRLSTEQIKLLHKLLLEETGGLEDVYKRQVILSEDYTFEVPMETTIENAPSVKLGLDSDKYNVLIAIGICLLGAGVVVWRVVAAKRALKRKEKRED